MLQKVKSFLAAHEREYELIRYLVAGGLTTVLSNVVFSVVCIVLAPDRTVNGATAEQVMVARVISWIIAVLFAFWINRRMVFSRKGGGGRTILIELGQFAFSRLASLLVFELGLTYYLTTLRESNAAAWLSNIAIWWIVQVLVMVFNYVVSKFWIFAKKPQPSPVPEAAPAAEEDSPPAQGSVKE